MRQPWQEFRLPSNSLPAGVATLLNHRDGVLLFNCVAGNVYDCYYVKC